MFTLFTIIMFAVMTLQISDSERRRPFMSIVIGVLCITLGGRAMVLLSDSFDGPSLGVLYASEEAHSGKDEAVADESATAPNSPESSLPIATSDVASDTKPHELAVEPMASFRYLTMPRPDWIETEATRTNDRFQIAVESGMHVRKRTAQKILREEVESAIATFVNEYLGSELASTLSGYAIEERQNEGTRTISLHLAGQTFEVVPKRFDEQVKFDYGIMNQSHALISIDENLTYALDQRWTEIRAVSRLFQMGLGAGGVLLLLGTMFSYLRLDTATRGYYTGRLQIGAAAAILAVVAVGVVCANRIPWM